MDTIDKGTKESKREGSSNASVAKLSADVLLWQLLASVFIPGYVVHCVTKLGSVAVQLERFKAGPLLKRAGPTALGTIPVPVMVTITITITIAITIMVMVIIIVWYTH